MSVRREPARRLRTPAGMVLGRSMRIFLSYRREDSSAWTGRLHDALTDRFGQGNVFQDVEAVRPGEDFLDAMERAIAQSEAVLVVIGPGWLAATDPNGNRRLDSSEDHVRTEIQTALRHNRRLIPILVGGASMPNAGQLPDAIAPLAHRTAVTLDDASWHQAVDRLVGALTGPASVRPNLQWLLAGLAGTAVVIALGVWLLTKSPAASNEDLSDSSGSELPAAASEDESSFPECERPDPPKWDAMEVEGDPGAAVDGWTVELLQAHRSEVDDGWQVVLRVSVANDGERAGYFDHFFFPNLYVEDVPYPVRCITYDVGGDLVNPGRRAEASVGYEVGSQPVGRLALEVTGHGNATDSIEWG